MKAIAVLNFCKEIDPTARHFYESLGYYVQELKALQKLGLDESIFHTASYQTSQGEDSTRIDLIECLLTVHPGPALLPKASQELVNFISYPYVGREGWTSLPDEENVPVLSHRSKKTESDMPWRRESRSEKAKPADNENEPIRELLPVNEGRFITPADQLGWQTQRSCREYGQDRAT